MKNAIGSNVTSKKTVSGLTAKDSEDFEKFVAERKRKQTRPAAEEEEKTINSKMPNFEGEPSTSDLAKQTAEITEEKHTFDSQNKE